MNFDKWYDKELPRQPIKTYKEDIKLGWDGCKETVLEILNQKYRGANTVLKLQDIELLYKEIDEL